jgi:hypothetical protein
MTTSGAALALVGHGGSFNGGFCHIKNCRFVDWWGNDYGIEFGAGAYNLIEDCHFEGYAAGIYMRSTTTHNPQSNVVKGCTFQDNVNGIEHRAGSAPHDFIYQDNVFVVSSVHVNDIDTTANLGDGIICGNRSGGTDAGGAGSFLDTTQAVAGGNDIKCSGNTIAVV